MYPTFQQFLAQWKAKFGCEPYIGQKVRIDPEAKYADEWADIAYVVYSFAPDRYRGGQVGITACLEDANDSHKSCTDWQISELIPSQENEIQHPAQTPLVLFSGISLKVHYRLGLELNWSWDEYGNWDEMVGSKSADVAKAMMAEKAKCSDDPTMTRLDYLALELMTAVIENNYSLPEVSYDGYENWESMIAAQCYSMAKSTENALNTSTPTA